MKQAHSLKLIAAAGALFFASSAIAQDNVPAEGAETANAANAAANTPKLIDPKDLKWNADLEWVSFIVDDGRVQSNRDYFGAVKKADLQALTNGSAKGMILVQQVFYYNPATRQFSRFDATSGGSVAILQKNAYFRPDSIMRMVPLNQKFVENLAVREFLNVAGE